MNIQQIIDFAKDNNVSPTDLQQAAHELTNEMLVAKLRAQGGTCEFPKNSEDGESNEVPYVLCTCFDSVVELRVASVNFDANDQVELHCVDDETNDEYTLNLSDIEYGQARFVIDEM